MADKIITDASVIEQILNALPEVRGAKKGLQSPLLLNLSDAQFDDANNAPAGVYAYYNKSSEHHFPYTWGMLFTARASNGTLFQISASSDHYHLSFRCFWDSWGEWIAIL